MESDWKRCDEENPAIGPPQDNNSICNWCNKPRKLKAMVSGQTMPMICYHCGSGPKAYWMDQDINKLINENDRLQASVTELSRLLSNLLAVIHRDGGQYEVEHGTAEACAEANRLIIAERHKTIEHVQVLKAENERLRKANEIFGTLHCKAIMGTGIDKE